MAIILFSCLVVFFFFLLEKNTKFHEMEDALKQKENEIESLKQNFKNTIFQKEKEAEDLQRNYDTIREELNKKEHEIEALKGDYERQLSQKDEIIREQKDSLMRKDYEIQQTLNTFSNSFNNFVNELGSMKNFLNIFTTSSGKGKLGEWTLEDVLRSVKVNGGLNYLIQPQFEGIRPDAAISAGKKYLYIDSKFPYDSYSVYQENSDPQTLKDFILAVNRQVENVRKYVSAKDSVGIAVLFLPSNGMMQTLIELAGQTIIDACNKKVIILSPFCLPYFLHMFVDCYSQLNLEDNFVNKWRDIASLIEKAINKFSIFNKDFRKANASSHECEEVLFRLHDILHFINGQKDSENSL